ncbi:M28 family peptidase [Breznakiella homolactica]|uniref:M28 family peptidase n=1 Tax=Breznakiella homolactica TaxID=2798577 RepID=A0A7T7XMY6_9SPIR|nr:M28 family peptidase [Breznakiella homolactica]QQO09324.1 M28 family peptidase [Breznakiella homolactica]
MFIQNPEILGADYLARFMPPHGRFREHLEKMAARPHDAATEANNAVVRYLADSMRSYGMDVDECSYDVLLSNPVEEESFIHIVSPEFLALKDKEDALGDAAPYFKEALKGFNSYSASGDVTKPVVFANYGRIEDFDHLAELGIDVQGKLVLIRYGKLFRGKCVVNAEDREAAGVIFYSDPLDYFGMPDSPDHGMHPSAIQRGNILDLSQPGDPLTPGKPAYTRASGRPVERLAVEDVKLPSIPVAPVSWEAASEIFKRLKGRPAAGEGWQGGLPLTYCYGDDYGLTVRLSVKQNLELSTITDVVGTIRGDTYPEQRVFMGSHFDGWGFGAVDPLSGTAMLLLVAETLGNMKKAGISFDRTISIGHWDGEESGIMGSTEWLEEFGEEVIEDRTLAYINADGVVSGPVIGVKGMPLMRGIMEEVGKKIPYDENNSLYEQWKSQKSKTEYRTIGGGSDHVGFIYRHGVPSCQMSMTNPAPVYHSLYDNLDWYKVYGDPAFSEGNKLAMYYLSLSLALSRCRVIPYSVGYLLDYIETGTGKLLPGKNGGIETEINEIRALLEKLQRKSSFSDAECQGLNSKLLGIEKFFFKEGPHSSWYRSLLYAADDKSGYGEAAFPFLADALESGGDIAGEIDELLRGLRLLKKSLSEF